MTGRHDDWSGAAGALAARTRRLVGSPLTARLGGVAVLGFVGWQLGFGPSLHALAAIDGSSLLAAVVVTALTTVCCAWRWSLVAAGLGANVPLGRAVAACYRSQFLNTATPGGVLGDVHRGVRHGREHGDTAKGVRSVFWERSAGQVVQALMALAVLTLLPSPLRPLLAGVWLAVLVGCACVVVARLSTGRRADEQTRAPVPPLLTAALAEARRAFFASRTWPFVVLASGLAVTGHVVTFVVAARTAGATAPTARLVPLAFVVLVSMGLPVNLAGWGPREGVSAWAFGAAGIGAEAGLSTAVVYGVLVFVASLPGAVVVLASRTRQARRAVVGPSVAAAVAAAVAADVAAAVAVSPALVPTAPAGARA